MVKIDYNKKGIKLYNDDCFDVFPKLKDKSIDLFVLDLPYGQTACAWDSCIDLSKMWIEIKRIMKPSAIICFFCTTKFGYSLIKSNEKWFKYDLVWQKSRKVGFLSANKRQLRNHENIYVFKEEQGTYHPQKTEGHKPRDRSKNKKRNDKIVYGEIKEGNNTDTTRHPTSIIEHENIYVFNNDDYNEDKEQSKYDLNINLVNYSKKILKYIGKNKKEIIKNIKGTDHFFRYSRGNFSLPIEKNYKKLIELYKIDKMKGFLKFKDMLEKWEKIPAIPHIYNPQKTEGTPYKTKGKGEVGVYKSKRVDNENKGDRHPTSIIENTILKYNNPHKTIHRTEKPIGLLEYLIKTYSNEGDTIMDFCAGSLSCGIAAFNTKRKFIGVEMDKTNYDLGLTRIKEHIEK